MKDELAKLSIDISDKFCNSDTYLEYINLRKKIQNDEILKDKINQYKLEQMSFQSKILSNIETTFEEESRISKLYTELFMNEIARNFLITESELLKILNMVYENIGKDIDISISL
ncbi:MAG: YlbF family regulator [Lachnospirales bacterium]